jgi:hypothetical protein
MAVSTFVETAIFSSIATAISVRSRYDLFATTIAKGRHHRVPQMIPADAKMDLK